MKSQEVRWIQRANSYERVLSRLQKLQEAGSS